MSYTPTNWQTGDTVTAEKLNKMESGIAAAAADPFVITCTPTAQDFSGVMDKTPLEIREAYDSNKKIVFRFAGSNVYYLANEFNPYNNGDYDTISVRCIMPIYNSGVWILGRADTSGTAQTYSTTLFSLTPMS